MIMKLSLLSTFLAGASTLALSSIELTPAGSRNLIERSVASGPEYYSGQPNQPPKSYQPPSNTNGFVPESEYRDALLRVHNDVRAAHGVSALTWSRDLVNYAMANSPSCEGYGHSYSLQQDGIGENILYGQSTPQQMVKELWYENELKLYNFNRQGYSVSTGHLTQMIWKATTEVGCMVRKCAFGTYVKCDYREKGNISGQFEQNCNAPKTGYRQSTPAYPNDRNYQSIQSYRNYQSSSNRSYRTYQSNSQNYRNHKTSQKVQSYERYKPTNRNQKYQSYNYYAKRNDEKGNNYMNLGSYSQKENCKKAGAANSTSSAHLQPETPNDNQSNGWRRPLYSPLYQTEKDKVYDITNPNTFNMIPGKTFRNIIYDQDTSATQE
ncbi:hypothetical protein TWF730_009012 [Orbilia blumenaviensis]|uniref:SCP domain-containing protein n=1 Tax=Orbilia blumenaviensis TaxID=1796055 RepID=A0AAV9V0E2_9PEZI